MLVFEESGKPEYPEKNLSSTPTYGVDAGMWTQDTLVGGECSHHPTILDPQPEVEVFDATYQNHDPCEWSSC